MPRRKAPGIVRHRIPFPVPIWDRIDALAASMHIDAASLVRIWATKELMTWEGDLQHGALSPGRSTEVDEVLLRGVDTEKLSDASTLAAAVEPQSEPEPEPARRLGFGPRGDLDELSSMELLTSMLSYR